jgi:hypothetical protein
MLRTGADPPEDIDPDDERGYTVPLGYFRTRWLTKTEAGPSLVAISLDPTVAKVRTSVERRQSASSACCWAAAACSWSPDTYAIDPRATRKMTTKITVPTTEATPLRGGPTSDRPTA